MAKTKDEGKEQLILTVLVLGIVIVLGAIAVITNMKQQNEFSEIGRLFCHDKGYNFWSASGSIIRCYEQDNQTAIRTEYEFWVDKGLCKEMYLGEQ